MKRYTPARGIRPKRRVPVRVAARAPADHYGDIVIATTSPQGGDELWVEVPTVGVSTDPDGRDRVWVLRRPAWALQRHEQLPICVSLNGNTASISSATVRKEDLPPWPKPAAGQAYQVTYANLADVVYEQPRRRLPHPRRTLFAAVVATSLAALIVTQAPTLGQLLHPAALAKTVLPTGQVDALTSLGSSKPPATGSLENIVTGAVGAGAVFAVERLLLPQAPASTALHREPDHQGNVGLSP